MKEDEIRQTMKLIPDEEEVVQAFQGPDAEKSLLRQAIEETSKVVKEMDEGLEERLSHWERQEPIAIVGEALVKMLGLAIQFYVATRRRD